jgi:enediyne biosynthesis protein E4
MRKYSKSKFQSCLTTNIKSIGFNPFQMSWSASLQIITLSCSLLFSCKKETTLFTSLPESETGINFQNTLFEDGPLNVANYIYFYNGGGVAIGDINNDGLQDVLFTGNMVRNRLYLNKGNMQFEDITKKSGVDQMEGWCTGATMSDVNNDGKLDIYICRSADINPERRKNLLFINNGDLTFGEKAEQFGLADNGYSTMASFLDYDKDGDLDCFIINHSIQKYTAGVQDNPELRKQKNPDYASKLYRNDLIPPSGGTQGGIPPSGGTKGGFTNVSDVAGITSNVLTFGLGVAISDFNNDGWPDISVSNDFNEPDYFFENNGNGTFTEKLANKMDNISLYSMGSDAADYDNDGNVDLLTLDMMPEDNKTIKMHSGAENFDKFQYLFKQGFYYQYSRNMLQHNNGDGTFSEVGQLAGVSNSDWSWAGLFGDYDNDGHKDLFITNGYVKDYTEMDFLKYQVDRVIKTMAKDTSNMDSMTEYLHKMPSNKIENYAFHNRGDGTFQKVSKEWGFDQKGVSAGAAYADLDNDGDLDLVVNNSNEVASILQNNAEKLVKNNYLSVKLVGGSMNQRGIGAKIKLFCKGELMYQEQSPVRGFQSSNDPVLNFGIGKNTIVDSLIIIWPNDTFQKLKNVKINQILPIKMADASGKWDYEAEKAKSIIFTQNNLSNIIHKENAFNDFTVQSLLPNYLSRQGPNIEVADVNKDGLDDIFMGSAKGTSSEIYLQNTNQTFTKKVNPTFTQNTESEDVASTFFDADNDGDLDLYVAAGGYEFAENDPLLQDRLYLNDGKGNFTKKEKALPKILASKGCVKAADIDGDGDLDLFVGGRLVPRNYPVSPDSYILLNDGKGNFTDSGFTKIGMVNDAMWLDLNNDKWPELITVGEWAPIQVFENNHGKLFDESSKYIHFASTGWWNKISAADMDNDGDLDLVIGNCGQNTQFKVSEKEPMTVHYKDFTENDTTIPILSYFIGGISYPAASRDDMVDPMPFLKKKFIEYNVYATATITDLFTAEQLKDAKMLKAQTMETVYLENEGAKGFIAHKLPLQAQYAPVYGIVIDDFNNDGKKDLLLAGGNTWTRIKFGRYAANHGVLLVGDGKNNFKYVPQNQSGLNLKGNIRSLKTVNSGKSTLIIAGVNDGEAILISKK